MEHRPATVEVNTTVAVRRVVSFSHELISDTCRRNAPARFPNPRDRTAVIRHHESAVDTAVGMVWGYGRR